MARYPWVILGLWANVAPIAGGCAAAPADAGGARDPHQHAIDFLSRTWEGVATSPAPVIVVVEMDRGGQYTAIARSASGVSVKSSGTWTVDVVSAAPPTLRVASSPRQACVLSSAGCSPSNVPPPATDVYQVMADGSLRAANGVTLRATTSPQQVSADMAAFDRTYGRPAPSYAGSGGSGYTGNGGLSETQKRMFDEHRAADNCLRGIGFGCGPRPTYH